MRQFTVVALKYHRSGGQTTYSLHYIGVANPRLKTIGLARGIQLFDFKSCMQNPFIQVFILEPIYPITICSEARLFKACLFWRPFVLVLILHGPFVQADLFGHICSDVYMCRTYLH